MKYVILYLILDAVTGQPIEVGLYDTDVVYTDHAECERAKAGLGPQKPVNGRVRVFACGTEKQVTVL